tara:strand:- start:85101 stop:85484 length:384 start_codon:yes stop_codon:yes gene_type:complete
MNMKSITAFALASLVLAGTACSQGSDSGGADVQTVSADESASGSFNLNLPSPTTGETTSSGGSMNLNLGGSSETRLIGSGTFGGGDFGGDPALDLNLNLDSEAAALDAQAAESSSQDDGIIRLDPKK